MLSRVGRGFIWRIPPSKDAQLNIYRTQRFKVDSLFDLIPEIWRRKFIFKKRFCVF